MNSRPLCHYTTELHLPLILAAGFLKVTESNIGSPVPGLEPTGAHYAPDVVWLSDSDEVAGLGLNTTIALGLGLFRFVVAVPDDEIHHWPTWRQQFDMNDAWRASFELDQRPESWWLAERPISRREWVAIHYRDATGGRWLPIPMEVFA